MNEYKITYQIETGVIFKTVKKGMDIVEAESAQKAMEKWKEENATGLLYIKMSDIMFSILGIEKI